jgi:predicted ATPase/DNA-binding XRE family transcriptional regulator
MSGERRVSDGEGESFGALLRRLRLEARLTQEELAERAGLSVRGISDLERGVNRTARRESARLFADALGLTGEERIRFLAAARGRTATSAPVIGALPIPPTPLIGRERESAAVLDLLAQEHVRLVTLTGVGGTGKTRLALEVATRVAGRFPDGVRFVDLAPLADPALVAAAVAQELGVTEQPGRTLSDALIAFLAGRRLLLVLDNFEHLLDAAPLVSTLIERCPGLVVLATSRPPLRLRGEHVFAVPPLPLPQPRPGVPVEVLAGNEAVTLFFQRAQAAASEFALDADNAETVADICRRLDGLPLAIELAAARVPLLSPAASAARLENRLALLTDGPRDLPTRQRTLRNAIDWSYQLLDPGERALFRRFAVFAGGATLDAIAAVVASEREPDLGVLNGTAKLVERDLLRHDAHDGGDPRMRVLETIREYALAVLIESGEEFSTRRRHAAYFTALAEAAGPHLRSGSQRAWLDRLEDEHDNFRAALDWSLRAGEAETALRLCSGLALFWRIRGHLTEGRRWCSQALALSGEAPPRARADALHGKGMLAHWQGNYEATEALYRESLALRRALGDERGIALSLNSLGILADDVGDYKLALTLQQESLRRWEALGEPWGIAHALCDIGNIAKTQARNAEAQSLYERSLKLFEQVGDLQGVAMVLDNLGELAMRQCAYDRAVTLFEKALPVQRALGYSQFIARLLNKLGTAKLAQGEIEQARALLEESLALQQTLGDRRGIGFSLIQLGNAARAGGDTELAATHYRESLRLRWSLGHKEGVAACLAALAANGGLQGQAALAARFYGAAAALRHAIGSAAPAFEQISHERGIAATRAQLGEDAFEQAWSVGWAADIDEVITEILEPDAVSNLPRSF